MAGRELRNERDAQAEPRSGWARSGAGATGAIIGGVGGLTAGGLLAPLTLGASLLLLPWLVGYEWARRVLKRGEAWRTGWRLTASIAAGSVAGTAMYFCLPPLLRSLGLAAPVPAAGGLGPGGTGALFGVAWLAGASVAALTWGRFWRSGAQGAAMLAALLICPASAVWSTALFGSDAQWGPCGELWYCYVFGVGGVLTAAVWGALAVAVLKPEAPESLRSQPDGPPDG